MGIRAKHVKSKLVTIQIDSFTCSVQISPNSSIGHMFKNIRYITLVSKEPLRSHLGKENAFF